MKSYLAIWVWVGIIALVSSPVEAKRIKSMDLKLGRVDDNRIEGPVYDTSGLPVIIIEPLGAAYDRDAEVVRSLGMGTKAWDLDSSINLAQYLSTELASAAGDLGFVVAPSAQQAWTIGGRLTDVFVESKAGFWGGIQHYGYIEVELNVRGPGGEARSHRFRAHEYMVNANAGLSQRDEATESVARLLVEAAPEIIARLNREHFAAPPHPSILNKLNLLAAEGVTDASRNSLRSIGLSGNSQASGVLLALLSKTEDENDRYDLINALANLGSSDIVAPLSQRYASEEEDCRFMIIKAMDYVGSPEAIRVVIGQATQDDGKGNRSRAELIRDRSIGTTEERKK